MELTIRDVKVIILEVMEIEITDVDAETIRKGIWDFENPTLCPICSAYEEKPVYHA